MKNDELDQMIEKSFAAEPGFRLPDDFAQKVTFQLVRIEQWKTDLREYLLLTAIVVGLIGIVSGIYYLIDKELIVRIFSNVSENAVLVILILFLLNFVFFADRVLLRLLFTRWNKT